MKVDKLKSYLEKLYNNKFTLNKIRGGLSSSEVYLLTFSDSLEPQIVKIFPKEYYNRFSQEVKILGLLETTKVPAPNIFHFNENLSDENKLIIEEYISGKTFLELLNENPVLSKDTLKSIGEVISNIHLISDLNKWNEPKTHLPNKKEWIDFVKKRNKLNMEDMSVFNIMNKSEIDLLNNYLMDFVNDLNRKEVFLCPIHGDLNPSNISISKETQLVNGIFDFELHKIAHNLNELGILYYWLKFYKKEKFFEEILVSYRCFIDIKNDEQKFIPFYYVMQIIGAISSLIKNNSDEMALRRLKEMLSDFLSDLD